MVRCRVAADSFTDDGDEIVAGEVRRRQPVLGVVGVHWISEAASEHRPVTPVDRDRIPDDGLTDKGAILESAHPRFEIVRQAKRLTNASAVSATSRQPLSIVSEWPRP